MPLENLGVLLFWVPAAIYLYKMISLIRIDKEKASIMVAGLPIFFFCYKIFTYRHWEADMLLIYYMIGLIISVGLFCGWLYWLTRRK